jgi:aryl-alcohol dehydrogenase-like predicted oxidoreductase
MGRVPMLRNALVSSQRSRVVQHELNVLADARDMLELCDNFDLASINRTPLAMGLLTGKFTQDVHLPSDDVRGNEPDEVFQKMGSQIQSGLRTRISQRNTY